jgi:L-rhamnose mutarotase
MKITKSKLQQIIKEELENFVNEEEAIDYAERQEGYEDKIFSMLVKNNMTKDPAKIENLRRNQEMMDYVAKVMTRPDDPMNKRDPDFAAKAKDAFMKAFDNVVRNLESGEYNKKPDVPPESPEAKREREIAFGQAMARGDYGKLD